MSGGKHTHQVSTARLTRFGFDWGPASVERAVEHEGHVVLSIKTARGNLHVRVTPTGFIRTEQQKVKR